MSPVLKHLRMGLGLGALGFLLVLGVRGLGEEAPPVPSEAPPPDAAVVVASDAGEAGAVHVEAAVGADASVVHDAQPDVVELARPKLFRVADLAADPSMVISDGAVAHRPFLNALVATGLSRTETMRVVKALQKVHNPSRARPTDTFRIVKDKASGHVVAFEYVTSPVDVFQAREDAGNLVATKLDLHLDLKQVAAAVTIATDLRAALSAAGLQEDALPRIEDALAGRYELADVKRGARLRVVATEERLEGAFLRYASVDAVEYTPPSANQTVRVYHFPPFDPAKLKPGAPAHAENFYDAKGQQPLRGGWRIPVPGARIASRFNLHRMHPTLHVIMPHNGVDFAAPVGTPIYAAASGTVKTAGDGGPCGNMVQLDHTGGTISSYCHMSRFAAGLHVGERVETRQLIGYVGQTGRATGPHLHFAIKRDNLFIDPLAMKLDGFRVVPPSKRDEFDAVCVDLDKALDAVRQEPQSPAPAPAPPEPEPVEPDGGADAAPQDQIFDEVTGQ